MKAANKLICLMISAATRNKTYRLRDGQHEQNESKRDAFAHIGHGLRQDDSGKRNKGTTATSCLRLQLRAQQS